MTGSDPAEAGRLALLGERLPGYLAQSPLLPGGPARAAVLAVHWHRALTSGGSLLTQAFTAAAPDVLPRMAGLLRAAREAGAGALYVRVCNPPETVTNNPIYWLAMQTGRLAPGSEETEILPEVAPEPGDVVLTHHRMSAFTGSDLDLLLRARGTQTLIIAGAATNIAVESTARDAADRGYHVVVAADCCVAATAAAHQASLESLALIVSRIAPASAIVAALRQAPVSPPPGTPAASRQQTNEES
jgi:nicotinamidase-related amidase